MQVHVARPMRPMYGNYIATLVRVGPCKENPNSNIVQASFSPSLLPAARHLPAPLPAGEPPWSAAAGAMAGRPPPPPPFPTYFGQFPTLQPTWAQLATAAAALAPLASSFWSGPGPDRRRHRPSKGERGRARPDRSRSLAPSSRCGSRRAPPTSSLRGAPHDCTATWDGRHSPAADRRRPSSAAKRGRGRPAARRRKGLRGSGCSKHRHCRRPYLWRHRQSGRGRRGSSLPLRHAAVDSNQQDGGCRDQHQLFPRSTTPIAQCGATRLRPRHRPCCCSGGVRGGTGPSAGGRTRLGARARCS